MSHIQKLSFQYMGHLPRPFLSAEDSYFLYTDYAATLTSWITAVGANPIRMTSPSALPDNGSTRNSPLKYGTNNISASIATPTPKAATLQRLLRMPIAKSGFSLRQLKP